MGEPFGKYELVRKLATGGMAEIWLARQRGMQGFEKPVVIKRILPHLSSDENFVRMFLDEGKMAASLNHPNIVQIYDLGCIEDQYFIAMEYVDGVDISTVLHAGRAQKMPLKLRFTLRIVSHACEGLHFAHFLRDMSGNPLHLIHRDVSPQNILISYTGSVKITDFGIAKARGRATKTTTGTLKGKFGYMSPEQIGGKPIDHRSDVFSLGTVLWEMLTYRRLFKRDNEAATVMAIAAEEVPSPRKYWPNLPSELETITLKALARDPDQRYLSARELGNDLEKFLSSQGMGVVPSEMAQFLDHLFPDKNLGERDHKSISGISGAAYRKKRSKSEDSESLPSATHPGLKAGLQPGELALAVRGVAQAAVAESQADNAGELERGDDPDTGPRMPTPRAKTAKAPPPAPQAKKAHAPGAIPTWLFIAVPLVVAGIMAGIYFALFRPGPLPAKPAPIATAPSPAPVPPPPAPAMAPEPPPKAEAQAAAVVPDPPPVKDPVKEPAKKQKNAQTAAEKKPREIETASPRKSEPARPAPGPAAPIGDGFLNLDSDPWAEVWSGDSKLGDTPLMKVKIPSGKVQLTLKNPELGFEKKITVSIAANETTAQRIAVKKGTLNITADTPVEVYLNKTKIGDTPLSSYEVFEGAYKVRLVNREKGLEKVISFNLGPGQTKNLSENFAK